MRKIFVVVVISLVFFNSSNIVYAEAGTTGGGWVDNVDDIEMAVGGQSNVDEITPETEISNDEIIPNIESEFGEGVGGQSNVDEITPETEISIDQTLPNMELESEEAAGGQSNIDDITPEIETGEE